MLCRPTLNWAFWRIPGGIIRRLRGNPPVTGADVSNACKLGDNTTRRNQRDAKPCNTLAALPGMVLVLPRGAGGWLCAAFGASTAAWFSQRNRSGWCRPS